MEKPTQSNDPVRTEESRAESAPMGMSGGMFEPGEEFPHKARAERRDEVGDQAAAAIPPGFSKASQDQTERTGIGGTIGGGLQGTQSGGTTQMDRMNPGPGGTANEQSPAGETPQSGMGGSRPDMGLPGEPPQGGADGGETSSSQSSDSDSDVDAGSIVGGEDQDRSRQGNVEGGTSEDLQQIDQTTDTSIPRQDTTRGGDSWQQDLQDEGEERRMGAGGGREGVGIPRQHNADGPQEVRETEGEP